MTLTDGAARYDLSFTVGDLLLREAGVAAPVYLSTNSWAATREQILDENLFQASSRASAQRLIRETLKRLRRLDLDELRFFAAAAPSEKSLLMWLAACRAHGFIAEFAEEVVRDRFLLLTPELDYSHFDTFVSAKALWHPELSELKESTLHKLRSNLFRMMSQAALLMNGQIQQALLTDPIRALFATHYPEDIRFFPDRSMEAVR